MRKSLCLLLMLACLSPIPALEQEKCPETGRKPGQYSQLSVDLCFQDWKNDKRHLKIPSPDHSVVLLVDGENAQLQANGRPIGEPFLVTRIEEWIWSPDSRAVIVTNIQGSSGPTGVYVSFVDNAQQVPDVGEIVEKDFAARHANLPCGTGPNVAGLGWLKDSKQAVLVAEVPASPRCEKADGYFEAYVVSIPEGRILARYSMKETIRRFRKFLGPVLLDDVAEQKEEHRN